MRYLFFDIECCDGAHICEFGYVITDDKFKVLEKKVIKINPDKPFRLTGRKNQTDLTLFFSEQEYYDSPLFTEYYDTIKKLIEHPDQIVIGHAIGNDAAFLRTACRRYGLQPINFDFVDTQKIYSEFANGNGTISLEKAESVFNLEKPEYLHKSDDDANLTAQLMKKMCSALEMTVQEVMTLCPTACGKSHNFNVMYTGNSLSEMLEALDKNPNALSNTKKQKCIRKFSEVVAPNGEKVKSKLNGTKICFSTRYEKENTKDTLKLIQLLANHGCQYNFSVTENDFYVALAEEFENSEEGQHTRFSSAIQSGGGRKVEILTFDQLFEILGITSEALATVKMPKAPKKKTGPDKRGNHSSNGHISTSLGEILRSKGIKL